MSKKNGTKRWRNFSSRHKTPVNGTSPATNPHSRQRAQFAAHKAPTNRAQQPTHAAACATANGARTVFHPPSTSVTSTNAAANWQRHAQPTAHANGTSPAVHIRDQRSSTLVFRHKKRPPKGSCTFACALREHGSLSSHSLALQYFRRRRA